MIGRLAGLRGRVSSHWLASAIAGAYLLASVALGIALLSNPSPEQATAAPAASTPSLYFDENSPPPYIPDIADDSRLGRTTATTTTKPRPTTTTTAAPPSAPAPMGFQRVNGPAGVKTVIPDGWRPTRSTGPGAMQAVDPGGSGRYVKFGGSDAPALTIESDHVRYENDYAVRSQEYRRLELSSAVYAGHAAVRWEFEHRDGTGVAHVASLYWRAGGKEYFLLASAPAAQWEQMKPIYDAMVANSDP
ncbi:MAG TPA: hypothetical protein VGR06_38720 [Actinophytocola sp.]|jgi:hypothetical protein|uniref:hypothetical protein n=1 Tax=Actinophytocola sp. TaxID=1872138 RepID=UPI002E09CD96|nr:hypothetical protein [Actinophytocola sp.]